MKMHILTQTHAKYMTNYAVSPSPNSTRSQRDNGSYTGWLHVHIWSRCKLDSAPPSLTEVCATMSFKGTMAHTDLYKEIRERTRTINESSCVRGEDCPHPLSHAYLTGGGCANTTSHELGEILKETYAHETYRATTSMFRPNTEGHRYTHMISPLP